MPSSTVRSRLSGRSLCSVLLSASGWFRPSTTGPSPSWWQAPQAVSNKRCAAPGKGAWAAALRTSAAASITAAGPCSDACGDPCSDPCGDRCNDTR